MIGAVAEAWFSISSVMTQTPPRRLDPSLRQQGELRHLCKK